MMKPFKTIAFALIAAASVSLASAGDFLNDFEAGKVQAKKEKKALLVKFTGSDWCPPCIKLDKEVFSKSEFKSAAEKDFVVVVLDFPRKKALPEAEKKANEAVAKEYKITGFPTVLLMDADGKVFKKAGYQPGGVKPFLAMLKTSLKAKKFH
ncbi:thioredoxin family protein [Verrucomicrobiaceae bacterium 227]